VSPYPSAGGGGGGAAGGNGSGSSNGAGGAGVSSSISGTATYYGGGGAGGTSSGGTIATGGVGGGGNSGVAGSANTGGGGGGGLTGGDTGAAGGSGVVIVAWSAANYVVGPGSSVANDVALFADSSGAVLKDGGALGSAAFTASTAYTAANAAVGGDLSGTLPNPTVVKIDGETPAAVATSGAYSDLSGKPTSLPPSGAAGGDLGGTYPDPTVTAIQESSGPSQLIIGAVPDGSFLKRSGGTLVGGTPAGGGNVTGPSSAVSGNVALFNGTSGEVIKDGGMLGTAAFQPSSAFDAAGAATAAIGSGDNAIFGLLVAQAAVTCKAVNYSTGGSVPLQFDLGNLAYIALTEAISLSPTGSSGLVQGRFQYVIITNPTSGSLALAVNDAWTVAGAIPSSLLPGQTIALFFQVNGTNESDVSVAAVGNAVTGPASAGSGNVALFNGTSGQEIEDGGPLGTAAFQPTTAFDSAGDATAAIDSGNNATFGLLVAQAAITCKTVSYATGGDVALGFDLGNLAYIALSEAISLSPTGSSGLAQGRSQYIFIANSTSGSLAITYNSAWTVAGSIPAELLPGQSLALFFQINGTSEADVSVAAVCPLGSAAFQAATAFDPAGAATEAISSGNNATFNLLVAEASVTFKSVPYGTGDSVQLGFDAGNVAYISLSVATISLSPSGSAGLSPGRTQNLVISNPLAEHAAIAYNSAWTVIGAIPSELAPGQSVALFFQVNGTSESDVVVTVFLNNTDVFNVKDYGATGIGTAEYDDTTAIQLAATALTIAGRGTLYFPDGRYYISDTIQVGTGMTYNGTNGLPYNANFTVKGNGRNASVIIINPSDGAPNLLYSLLSGTDPHGQGQNYNRIEIRDLGLRTYDAAIAGAAIYIDYGSIVAASSEIPSGSLIENVDIGTDALNNTGGFTSGIIVNNPWKFNILNVNGYGCGDDNVIHLTGAGSQDFINIIGGNNLLCSHIYGCFWARGITINPNANGETSQGFISSDVILIAVMQGLTVNAGKVMTNMQLSNWLVDQGDSPNDGFANIAYLISGDPTTSDAGQYGQCVLSGCYWTQSGADVEYPKATDISCGIFLNNVNYSVFQGCIAYANGQGGAVYIQGTSNYNVFSTCNYAGGDITLGGDTAFNQFNNIRNSRFINSGASTNTSLQTLY
jgi:hypothetical protein